MWNLVLPNYMYFCKHIDNEIKKKIDDKGQSPKQEGESGSECLE